MTREFCARNRGDAAPSANAINPISVSGQAQGFCRRNNRARHGAGYALSRARH